MAAKSKNIYDIYLWIKEDVINSVCTYEQRVSTQNLINNFEKLCLKNPLIGEVNTTIFINILNNKLWKT